MAKPLKAHALFTSVIARVLLRAAVGMSCGEAAELNRRTTITHNSQVIKPDWKWTTRSGRGREADVEDVHEGCAVVRASISQRMSASEYTSQQRNDSL